MWVQLPGMFLSPLKTLERVSTRTAWFVPWLVMAVVQGGLSLLLTDPRIHEFPAPVVVVMSMLSFLNPGVTLLVQIAMLSGVLFIFSRIQGFDDLTFGRWYSVLMWVFIPIGTVGVALRVTTRVIGQLPYAYFGPAVLMPVDHGFVKVFLVSLDLFSLLVVGLTYYGAYVLTKARSKATAVAAAVVVYGFFLVTSYLTWR